MTSTSNGITYKQYLNESQVAPIMSLIENDLSEPYSIYTYLHWSFSTLKIAARAMKIKNTGLEWEEIQEHGNTTRLL